MSVTACVNLPVYHVIESPYGRLLHGITVQVLYGASGELCGCTCLCGCFASLALAIASVALAIVYYGHVEGNQLTLVVWSGVFCGAVLLRH
jgi:hypothetical protein